MLKHWNVDGGTRVRRSRADLCLFGRRKSNTGKVFESKPNRGAHTCSAEWLTYLIFLFFLSSITRYTTLTDFYLLSNLSGQTSLFCRSNRGLFYRFLIEILFAFLACRQMAGRVAPLFYRKERSYK